MLSKGEKMQYQKCNSGILHVGWEIKLALKQHRHFHPSANLEPSKADVRLTDRMIKVGDLMGIPLIDHVIVGGDNRQYFSLRAREMIKNPAIPLQSNYRQLDFESQLVAEKGKSR